MVMPKKHSVTIPQRVLWPRPRGRGGSVSGCCRVDRGALKGAPPVLRVPAGGRPMAPLFVAPRQVPRGPRRGLPVALRPGAGWTARRRGPGGGAGGGAGRGGAAGGGPAGGARGGGGWGPAGVSGLGLRRALFL